MKLLRRLGYFVFSRSASSKPLPEGTPVIKMKPFPQHSDRLQRTKWIILAFPAACFGLGTWQIFRKRWKEFLIEEMRIKTRADPIDLPEDLNDVEFMEYNHVKLRGEFDHSREVFIAPRSLEEGKIRLREINPYRANGALIVTPFKLADRDETVLINRGWVRREFIPQSTRQDSLVHGVHELKGVVRMSEKPNKYIAANNDAKHGKWAYRDIDAIAYSVDASPVYIDLDKDYGLGMPNAPIAGQTNVNMRNEHRNYIIIWFSIGAITSWLWANRFMRVRSQDLSALDRFRSAGASGGRKPPSSHAASAAAVMAKAAPAPPPAPKV